MGITYRVVCHEQVIARDIPLLSENGEVKLRALLKLNLFLAPKYLAYHSATRSRGTANSESEIIELFFASNQKQ